VCRGRLLSQVVARSDGAVDTLRLKDEGEVAGPVDITGRVRNIQPEHAAWTREGVPGQWRQGPSPACGGAEAQKGRGGVDPAAVLFSVVIAEQQRARIDGPGEVDLKTDAHYRDRLGQDLVKDQDAVWADARGDLVPGRRIRVQAVECGTADVSERGSPAAGLRGFGGWLDSAWVVRRKR